jgi:hypothetical protein
LRCCEMVQHIAACIVAAAKSCRPHRWDKIRGTACIIPPVGAICRVLVATWPFQRNSDCAVHSTGLRAGSIPGDMHFRVMLRLMMYRATWSCMIFDSGMPLVSVAQLISCRISDSHALGTCARRILGHDCVPGNR